MRKYNLTQVKSIVENEGLGYAVQHYMSYEKIDDIYLAAMWKKAKDALDFIEKYLEPVEFKDE